MFHWSSQKLVTAGNSISTFEIISIKGKDTGTLYAMKVLKKATLKVFVYSKEVHLVPEKVR